MIFAAASQTGVPPRVAQVAHGPGADHQRFDGANHDLVAELLQLIYRNDPFVGKMAAALGHHLVLQ